MLIFRLSSQMFDKLANVMEFQDRAQPNRVGARWRHSTKLEEKLSALMTEQ